MPVVPIMSTGATDGRSLRRAGIPTYGVSGLFDDVDDVRSHGKDERISAQAYYEGLEFMYRLVKALSSGESAPNGLVGRRSARPRRREELQQGLSVALDQLRTEAGHVEQGGFVRRAFLGEGEERAVAEDPEGGHASPP